MPSMLPELPPFPLWRFSPNDVVFPNKIVRSARIAEVANRWGEAHPLPIIKKLPAPFAKWSGNFLSASACTLMYNGVAVCAYVQDSIFKVFGNSRCESWLKMLNLHI
jgi:hypothetical protein